MFAEIPGYNHLSRNNFQAEKTELKSRTIRAGDLLITDIN